jgi:hypothetical protein
MPTRLDHVALRSAFRVACHGLLREIDAVDAALADRLAVPLRELASGGAADT